MTWRENFKEKAAFAKVRKAENNYALRLRKLAQHINDLVYEFVITPDIEHNYSHLENLLARYADIVEPWARSVANRFVTEVARRDEQAWATYSKKLSRGIEQEILTAPTGEMLREFLESQVQLIKSLPLDAAQRVHEIATGNLYSGARFPEIANHLMQTGNISKNRANLIARTETARISSSLTMVRAQHIGSEGYIWRTVRDSDVRQSHLRMEGQFVRWDSPPEVDPGKHYHAGMFPNCRCFPEVVIPDQYLPKAA
jgi:SPP1 gp7 family putative phage head morphogenesis protein